MLYPTFNDITKTTESLSNFGGYNHTLSCQEGEFYEMANMSSDLYPILTPRKKRSTCTPVHLDADHDEIVGMLGKGENLYLIKRAMSPEGQGSATYASLIEKNEEKLINYVEKDGNDIAISLKNVLVSEADENCPKKMLAMGSKIVIFPDKIYYDTKTGYGGYLYQKNEITAENVDTRLSFMPCDSNGDVYKYAIEDVENVKNPTDGLVAYSTSGTGMVKYSAATKMWVSVQSYMKIVGRRKETPSDTKSQTYIGYGFEAGDCVTVTLELSSDLSIGEDIPWAGMHKTFSNIKKLDNDHVILSTDVPIEKFGDTKETMILPLTVFNNGVNTENYPNYFVSLTIERKVPDMEYVCECNNRIWGCSPDGHEIYCSKLGDPTNWYYYQGQSIDSWSATVGSDGVFTGCVNYLGYPIFFKEGSIIKINVSATGAHQYKETPCRGAQLGSGDSLQIINEVLYYKAVQGVCAYTGTVPRSVSDNFGDVKYHDAVSGALGDKYYISMLDADDRAVMFVYDTAKGLWHKEDSTRAIAFCSYNNDLLYISKGDSYITSVSGAAKVDRMDAYPPVNQVNWMVESGVIGYANRQRMYVSRIALKMSLDLKSMVDFYIEYDSSGIWEHKFNMFGRGTRQFMIPIRPRRCDHFRYKIIGSGDCKIFAISKMMEEGSDT